MKKASLLLSLFLLSVCSFAKSIVVKNIDELNAANKTAMPGDVVILENGQWNNVSIVLDCNGTKEQPIIFKARTGGKVQITGNSRLKLGGSYVTVDGLYFINGYAGNDEVISFRINKDKLANNCRVTNCAIEAFNNAKRMDENNWIAFHGKNNRLDHCTFRDKKNMGVLLAVHLDDDRSRENFHSIDHNYFGWRRPLASNGGEIIRVGVSQHCQFNSNTVIADNHFEECDGETEIISIKSGSNIIRGNLFERCQGAVVLRHGDNNTVENNVFLGYDKEGTGGVRIINRGQWVVNNLFYKCRGVDFRSPMAIMNGVPNSPANRYVQVTEAVIANNSFYECTPISFAEGSDKERSMPPDNVYFFHNIFYNSKDSLIYNVYDNISGIKFRGNMVSQQVKQDAAPGFNKTAAITTKKADNTPFPYFQSKILQAFYDSLQKVAVKRLGHPLSPSHGFQNLELFKKIKMNESKAVTGAPWGLKFVIGSPAPEVVVKCSNAEAVYDNLANPAVTKIILTGNEYHFDKPLVITRDVWFKRESKNDIRITTGDMLSLFVLSARGYLWLHDMSLDGAGVKAKHFIATDTAGWSDRYGLWLFNSTFKNFSRDNGCMDIFHSHKSMVADGVRFDKNTFINNSVNIFSMNDEKDDKGYYNAEQIDLTGNTFKNNNGFVADIYRGGNDESTLGPKLEITKNTFENCNTPDQSPLIQLTGVQKTLIQNNTFTNCVAGKKLIIFKDIVRARHLFEQNKITNSGTVETNQFLISKL